MKPRRHLLVVDDSRELAENLVDIFVPRGFEVFVARSAQEARERAEAAGFDLALVDVNLPDSSGHELLPALRAASPLGEVVLITGYATIDSAIAAVRGGAFHYVVKPFKVDDLITTAESALRQAALRRERAELARRAAEAEALAQMGTLAAGLAHEIRNPLNAALLQLHLLGRGIDRLPHEERAPLRARVTIVESEIKRLEHLLSDFLELARPRPMAREPVDLRQLVMEVLTLHEPTAAANGVTLSRDLHETTALGDRERLKQVLHNLLANALEATAPGGEITVSTKTVPGDLSAGLSVSDNGRGIPRATLERVFEPFFTTKAAGTGLGLAIVWQIVERHGGRVELESDEGLGTRVKLFIPGR